MKVSKNIHWGQVAVDGIVIVVSILLAFWIDATRDSRQSREEEKAILSTLLNELRDLQDQRQRYKNYYIEIRNSTRRLAEVSAAPNDAVTGNQLDAWLADTTWISRGTFGAMPVLASLTDGGVLNHISNNDLRVLVSQLHLWLEREKSDAVREQWFMDSRYNPYLDANASVAQIWAADDGEPGVPVPPGNEFNSFVVGNERFSEAKISHRELLAQKEFQNLLLQRINLLNNLIQYSDGEVLANTIGAIESELAR